MKNSRFRHLRQCWLWCLVIIIGGCQSYKPTETNMVGQWVVDDALAKRTQYRTSNTVMYIYPDQTFTCNNIDPALILTGPPSRSPNLLAETSGTWSIAKEGYLVYIHLGTKNPEHSIALTGVPSRRNGEVFLEVTSIDEPIYFKKIK